MARLRFWKYPSGRAKFTRARGFVLYRAKDFSRRGSDGGTQFSEVVRSTPDSPEAHFYLGSALFNEQEGKGDLQAPIAEFYKALRLKPDYPEAQRSCIGRVDVVSDFSLQLVVHGSPLFYRPLADTRVPAWITPH